MTYSEIIAQWPAISVLADEIGGVPVGVVKQWKRRNSIPSRYWSAIVRAAEARGIDGITIEALARLADVTAASSEVSA